MSFTTLTYDNQELIWTEDYLPTLFPRHTQLFLKSLRKAYAPITVRFFLVGEYGDETQRPHYHIALFGIPGCARGQTTRNVRTGKCCPSCDRIAELWRRGQIFQGELNENSIRYCASYTTKKMTTKDDFRLNGRHPEFTRMSRRPGLGYDVLQDVADTWTKHNLDRKMIDVPRVLRTNGRIMPLDPYARKKLRQLLDRPAEAPPQIHEIAEAEMQALRDFAETEEKTLAQVIKEQRQPAEDQYRLRQRVRPRKKQL